MASAFLLRHSVVRETGVVVTVTVAEGSGRLPDIVVEVVVVIVEAGVEERGTRVESVGRVGAGKELVVVTPRTVAIPTVSSGSTKM